MQINTLQTERQTKPNFILYLFALLGVCASIYLVTIYIQKQISNSKKIDLEVLTPYNQLSDIYINNEKVGVTPLKLQTLKPGNSKIEIKNGDRSYETTLNLQSGVAIIRDLGISNTFSSGTDMWFEKETSGNTLRIISEPTTAKVFIDNAEIGATPLTSSKITPGDYDLRIELDGFEIVKTRIHIEKGYTTSINVKMFPLPIPNAYGLFKDSTNLYDLSTNVVAVNQNPQEWVKAVMYWLKTRNTEAGLIQNFDYYLDYLGNLYNTFGGKITEIEAKDSNIKIAYLGNDTTSKTLSVNATQTYERYFISAIKKAKILTTPTGWLRVRENASAGSKELTTVNVGESFVLKEEQGNWVKIVLKNGSEGWISKTYVSIE